MDSGFSEYPKRSRVAAVQSVENGHKQSQPSGLIFGKGGRDKASAIVGLQTGFGTGKS
jgi:hypothetical protein